jgi:hypothetical protein
MFDFDGIALTLELVILRLRIPDPHEAMGMLATKLIPHSLLYLASCIVIFE